MKRKLAVIYAITNTILLIAGFVLVFLFACAQSLPDGGFAVAGMALGFIFAPIVHELGHVFFAWIADVQWVYVKCLCFKFYRVNGKPRMGFISPFAPDETQVLPKRSGDMQRRAEKYTLGGLIFSGIALSAILLSAIVCSSLGTHAFVLWGIVPYFAYLFLLNVAPFEYASGKTDALVYYGIRRAEAAERTMLSAMEIQGFLSEGKSFAEIDERLYDTPQLCEDEPLFAVMLDLRYRYYLDKNDLTKAGEALNRLAQVQEYLTDEHIYKVAAELTYMHAVGGDIARADECAKLCGEYLQSGDVTAKRALLAYSAAVNNTEAVALLKAQALVAIEKETICGVRKFEKNLISRLCGE